MKKMDRQPNQSTSSPPTDGPTAGARITPTVNSEMARPCSCGWKARMMMMAGMGCSTPAASPSMTRAASTSGKLCATPPRMPPAISTTMQPT